MGEYQESYIKLLGGFERKVAILRNGSTRNGVAEMGLSASTEPKGIAGLG